MHIDASKTTKGAVLVQEDQDKAHYAIYYIEKNLRAYEQNYTIMENDFLIVVYSINKFHHYIIGY